MLTRTGTALTFFLTFVVSRLFFCFVFFLCVCVFLHFFRINGGLTLFGQMYAARTGDVMHAGEARKRRCDAEQQRREKTSVCCNAVYGNHTPRQEGLSPGVVRDIGTACKKMVLVQKRGSEKHLAPGIIPILLLSLTICLTNTHIHTQALCLIE